RPSLQRRPDEHGPAPGGASGKVFATLPNKARQEEWSLVDFLARVVAEQSSATNDRRLAARLRYARFPFRKTLEDFDFEFQPRVDRKLIGRGVAALHRREQPVLFLGQPGCDKTHLAVAVAMRAIEAGYRGFFTNADEMVTKATP